MKLVVAAVGKVRSKHFRAACDDYAGRLQHYADLKLVELRDSTKGSAAQRQEQESQALLAAAPERSALIVLDERGTLLDTQALSGRINEAMVRGVAHWTLCIGGSEGHSEELRKRADWVWSLTPLTLPHELARVVVLEQLYRAMTILRGEKYHRAG